MNKILIYNLTKFVSINHSLPWLHNANFSPVLGCQYVLQRVSREISMAIDYENTQKCVNEWQTCCWKAREGSDEILCKWTALVECLSNGCEQWMCYEAGDLYSTDELAAVYEIYLPMVDWAPPSHSPPQMLHMNLPTYLPVSLMPQVNLTIARGWII